MDNLVRIESIEINGIKNVVHGLIEFDELNHILKGDFLYHQSILGIYGQNGSGKTTVLEVTYLLKMLLSGYSLDDEFKRYVNHNCENASLLFSFFMVLNNEKYIITYNFEIGNHNNKFDIIYEKMTMKKFEDRKESWSVQNTIFEIVYDEITLKKMQNKLSKNTLIELRVAKDILRGSSLIFNERNFNLIYNDLKEKNSEIINILMALKKFSSSNLFVVLNDNIGTREDYLPLSIYLNEENEFNITSIMIDGTTTIPYSSWDSFVKSVDKIDILINAIVPSIHLRIIDEKKAYLEDGEYAVSFDIVTQRGGISIPLRFESEGIKRIISIASTLIATYNIPSMCVMIDEFDSGIFEYLLGEIIEIFEESAKGQLLFTSHNLRPLEKMLYKNVYFTTVNSQECYIRLKNVKPNNNLRDLYYTNILLGGQENDLYEETKSFRIKRALRMAGRKNE